MHSGGIVGSTALLGMLTHVPMSDAAVVIGFFGKTKMLGNRYREPPSALG